MGNCCGGAGCCVTPPGSCPARGGQVVSIIGLILAAIFLILSTYSLHPVPYIFFDSKFHITTTYNDRHNHHH